MIRVMLVDDHEMVRAGVKSFLSTQNDFQVVAEAANGEEALEKAARAKPDVILMDVTMPVMDGIEATRRLQTVCEKCPVLVLTVHEDKQYFFEMLNAGASGYISKRAAPDELLDAIRAVATGQVYLQPTLARWLLEDYRRLAGTLPHRASMHLSSEDHPDLGVLTERELQVLELVALGETNPTIGEQLNISAKTVARHRERIMDKLNLHSRTELVKFAIKTGLIGLDSARVILLCAPFPAGPAHLLSQACDLPSGTCPQP